MCFWRVFVAKKPLILLTTSYRFGVWCVSSWQSLLLGWKSIVVWGVPSLFGTVIIRIHHSAATSKGALCITSICSSWSSCPLICCFQCFGMRIRVWYACSIAFGFKWICCFDPEMSGSGYVLDKNLLKNQFSRLLGIIYSWWMR